MSKVSILGIDIAKNVFQLHGVDKLGHRCLKKRLKRDELLDKLSQLPPCVVGIEACGGAHYWAREISQLGHEVKLMSPQHVKPYVKTNKNDQNDAEGICEAVSRPSMRFVPVKTIEQQSIQTLHRARSQAVKQKTAAMNSVRGLLLEYGICIRQGESALYKRLAELTSPESEQLPTRSKTVVTRQYEALQHIDEDVAYYSKEIKQLARTDAICQRLMSIPGIGDITATALCGAVGAAESFKNGRGFSAWLSLVPKQCSSGNRQRLLGISKRGDVYLRSLLVHGARSVVLAAHRKTCPDAHDCWIQQLAIRCGWNKTVVAVANKTARMAYALLAGKNHYDVALAHNDSTIVDCVVSDVVQGAA